MDINIKYYSTRLASRSLFETSIVCEAATWAGRYIFLTAGQVRLLQGAGFGLVAKGVAVAATPVLSLFMTEKKVIAIATNVFGGIAAFWAFKTVATLGLVTPISIPVALALTVVSIATALYPDRAICVRVVDQNNDPAVQLRTAQQDLQAEKEAHQKTKENFLKNVQDLTTTSESEKQTLKRKLEEEKAGHSAEITRLQERIQTQKELIDLKSNLEQINELQIEYQNQQNKLKHDCTVKLQKRLHTLASQRQIAALSEPKLSPVVEPQTNKQKYDLGWRLLNSSKGSAVWYEGLNLIKAAAEDGLVEAKQYLQYLEKGRAQGSGQIDSAVNHYDRLLSKKKLHALDKADKDKKFRLLEEQVKRKKTEVIIQLTMASQNGDLEATMKLAQQYYANNKYAKALPHLKIAAAANNALAQRLLGECYEYGHGEQRNWTQALEWYQKASANGDCEAQCRCGDALAFERGYSAKRTELIFWSSVDRETLPFAKAKHSCPSNYAIALQIYQAAADKDYLPAKYRLAVMHQKGLGTAQEHQLAGKLIAEYGRRTNTHLPTINYYLSA